jgi:transposase
VRELVVERPLKDVVEALLTALQEVSRQVDLLTRRLMAMARRLMTAPGVGSLVALAYISVIDAPDRFSSSSSVGAYLGLTPPRYQSGEVVDQSGWISKCSDPFLRTYLFAAAGILLNRVSRWSALKATSTDLFTGCEDQLRLCKPAQFVLSDALR